MNGVALTVKDSYIKWLKDEIVIEQDEIITPFLDFHNDHISIFCKQENDKILLSDGGITYDNLEEIGLNMEIPTKKNLISMCLSGYPVSFDEKTKEVYIKASISQIASAKHSLIQAVMSLNDISLTGKYRLPNAFKKEVARVLDELDITYTKDKAVSGAFGSIYHKIDFIIPRKNAKEIFIKAINNPSKQALEAAFFEYADIKNKDEIEALIVYNDYEYNLSEEMANVSEPYANVLRISDKAGLRQIYANAA